MCGTVMADCPAGTWKELNMENVEVVRTKARKTTPEEEDWLTFIRKQKQQTVTRIEEAGKALATMLSIALSILLAAGKFATDSTPPAGEVKWGLAIWLVSLLLSFVVLFPIPYRVNPQSAKDIERWHKKVNNVKYALLAASVLSFLAALTILTLWLFRTS